MPVPPIAFLSALSVLGAYRRRTSLGGRRGPRDADGPRRREELAEVGGGRRRRPCSWRRERSKMSWYSGEPPKSHHAQRAKVKSFSRSVSGVKRALPKTSPRSISAHVPLHRHRQIHVVKHDFEGHKWDSVSSSVAGHGEGIKKLPSEAIHCLQEPLSPVMCSILHTSVPATTKMSWRVSFPRLGTCHRKVNGRPDPPFSRRHESPARQSIPNRVRRATWTA